MWSLVSMLLQWRHWLVEYVGPIFCFLCAVGSLWWRALILKALVLVSLKVLGPLFNGPFSSHAIFVVSQSFCSIVAGDKYLFRCSVCHSRTCSSWYLCL